MNEKKRRGQSRCLIHLLFSVDAACYSQSRDMIVVQEALALCSLQLHLGSFLAMCE